MWERFSFYGMRGVLTFFMVNQLMMAEDTANLQYGATQAAIEQLNFARRANDADYYVLSEVDARLRELQQRLKEERIEAGKERRPTEEKK